MHQYEFTKEYDAVVIGAGNGGLTAAATLAKRGLKTLLVEQHNLPGGFATSFVRGRFEFEPSLHEVADIGPPDDKGGVRQLLEDRIGLEWEWYRVPDAYRLIAPDHSGGKLDITMPFGINEYVAKLEEYDPGSSEKVLKFMDLCKEVLDALGYIGESRGNIDKNILMKEYPNFLKTAPYSLQQVMDSLKMSKKTQQVMTAYFCYLGLGTEKMSFTIFGAMFYKYITKGAYIPKDRSHGYTLALEMLIRQAGGDILYNTKAEKILVKDNQVIGVTTSNNDVIKTTHVVSNAGAHLVYNELIYPKSEVPDFAYKTCNARQVGFSSVVVYLGLNKSKEQLGLTDYGYFIYATPDTNEIYDRFGKLERSPAQATICLNNGQPDCSPPGTTILSMTTLYRGDCWADVKPEEYFDLKRKLADYMIEDFEKAVGVDIRDSIEEIEIATPSTFARYTGTYNGSIYGYEPEPWDSIMPRLMTMNDEKYIKGLELAGGFAVRCHGYSSTLLSGEMAGLLAYKSYMEDQKK